MGMTTESEQMQAFVTINESETANSIESRIRL